MKKESSLNLIALFILSILVVFIVKVGVVFVVTAVIAEVVMGVVLPIINIVKISVFISAYGWGAMFLLLGIYKFYMVWKNELGKTDIIKDTKPESTVIVEIVEEVR